MKRSGKKSARQSLLMLLAAALIVTGCGDRVAPGTAQVKRPAVRGVSVASLSPAWTDDYYEATGTIRSASVSQVASRTMGTITSLLVKEGDRVQRGQLLLTLDDRDMVQRVRAAESGVQEASRAMDEAGQRRGLADVTYERYRKMFEQRAISRQEMDQFTSQKKVADLEYERAGETVHRAAAGLSEARVMLGHTRILSPVKGVVTEKRVELGSMAVPGMPLLTVEETARFNAEITVDEAKVGKMESGTPVAVSIEALGRQVTGKIVQILPSVDPLSRTFTVKVSVSGPGLRSGLFARVMIPQGKREVLLAPRPAVVERGQLVGVYTVDDKGVILYRLVKTGREHDGNVEILSGLRPGDRIVVGGVEKAVDGGLWEGGKL